MRSSEIGQVFLRFHHDKAFSVLPGSSLLDPSIPFTFVMSAGLVQIEMALNQREDGWNGKRYVMLQKCFRHFDVQTVGSTDMHLSLFEMPAAFLFGSCDKVECVRHMWELLTSALGLSKDELCVTYFSGDEISGHFFDEDCEVYQAWREVGLPPERIIGSSVDTNFWKQGDGISGMGRYHKCGSNTEVFLDRGSHLSCGPDCGPGCHCGRFVEVANSLFVDTEIDGENNTLRPLAMPFSELVVGTERLAMVLQGQDSVFEIDSFAPIKTVIREFSSADGMPPEIVCVSENILADHWRALFFLVADGAPSPGRDGRQRIIKILVRSILTRQIILGISHDFLPVMADTIIAVHQEASKLVKARNIVLQYITEESERFMKTLARGKCQFRNLLTENSGRTLTGEQIVFLEKRRGVPSALVEKWLLGRELSFNKPAYENALEEWRRSLDTRTG